MQDEQRRSQVDPAAERRVRRLQHEIDERDETIRLLNEALSKALDEIERLNPRRAA